MGEVVLARTSPPLHSASIVVTSTIRVNIYHMAKYAAAKLLRTIAIIWLD